MDPRSNRVAALLAVVGSAVLGATTAPLEASAATELVSRAQGASGPPGNAASQIPSVSSDGSVVAFESTATNLVPEDTDSIRDIYVRVRSTDETILVSRATTGEKGNAESESPAISADGRFVAFASDANNLVPGAGGARHVYLRDLVANTTAVVDVGDGPAGEVANAHSGAPSVSADGRRVAFASAATNLGAPDTNGHFDIYLRDLIGQTTTLVSRGAGGAGGNHQSAGPTISADGSGVAFFSFATNLLAATEPSLSSDTGGIYVFDLDSGTTALASRASGPNGAVVRSDVFSNSISADGSRVAFWTQSDTPHPADRDNGFDDVFVRDLRDERTIMASRGIEKWGGERALAASEATISANGRMVAFKVFYAGRRSRLRASVRDLSRRKTFPVRGAQNSERVSPLLPTLSGDGHWLAFQSLKRYDDDEQPGIRDVFVTKASKP